jgi:undecaprenyl-diphosphatase
MHGKPLEHDLDALESTSRALPNTRRTPTPSPPASTDRVGLHGTRSRLGADDDVTVRWSDAWTLLACYVGLVAVWYLVGVAITNSASVTKADDAVAEWFVERRTPALDTASHIGSYLAETVVKILVTAVIAIGMKLAWKRWREPVMVVLPLVLEACVFITVTVLVDRSRPDVERLDTSPVGSSFPSGHVAAAAAYAAVIIVVYWHTTNRWWRLSAIAAAVAVVTAVATARMYRGMHFVTDVVAGAALGLASVAVCWWVVQRAVRRTGELHSDRP